MLLKEVLHEVTGFFGSEELGVRQHLEATTDHGTLSHVTVASLAQLVKAPGPRSVRAQKFNPLHFLPHSGEFNLQSLIQV